MFKKTIISMGKVLTSPKEVFGDQEFSKMSIPTLMFVFYLLLLVAGLLSYTVTTHEGVKEFQVELATKQALKLMPGASEADEVAMQSEIRNQLYSPGQQITGYISLTISSYLGLMSSILLFWAYMTVVLRFAGGEESPVMIKKKKGPKEKKHRNSYILSYYRYLPLLIGGFISAILLIMGNKESFYNITSLEDLTRKMSVNLTLYALLFEGALPTWIETFLNILTSPFWWWSGWITVEGMKKVWKIPTKKAIIIFSGFAVLTALFLIGSMALTSFFTA